MPNFPIYGTCAECKRGPRNLTSRGLCSVCGAKPEVRAKHPSKFELEMLERGETLEQASLRRYYEARGQNPPVKKDGASEAGTKKPFHVEKSQAYRVGSWGLTRDPFTSGRFADGLPGTHAQVTPMEGMYSQPEHKEAA